jgi:glycolate oxidase FAD binding subunit
VSPPDHPLGDGRVATAVDRPETVEALREAVARRVAEGQAIFPQGGQTSLDYGGPPRRPGVAIDLRGLDRVVDYPAADMTITVEAGLTLARLQATLAGHRQRLPLDAPRPERATLGGIFATNTSGPRRFGAGRPRDMILGVTFVTADGRAVKGGGRVVKNVAGYDLPKLLTGSLGTLGIIAELTLKARPMPEASAIVFAAFEEAKAVGSALDGLNTSGTRPIAIELLNAAGARVVCPPTVADGRPWVLAVGFEDNAVSVAWQVGRLLEELGKTRAEAVVVEGAEVAPIWSALAEFQAEPLGPLTFVANLRRSGVVPFVAGVDPERWSIQAHAGSGIVRAHALDGWAIEDLAVEVGRLRAQAVDGGGNVILSRCPTEWKERLGVWGTPRGDWALAEAIKRALDPGGVMNPGRFVGTI